MIRILFITLSHARTHARTTQNVMHRRDPQRIECCIRYAHAHAATEKWKENFNRLLGFCVINSKSTGKISMVHMQWFYNILLHFYILTTLNLEFSCWLQYLLGIMDITCYIPASFKFDVWITKKIQQNATVHQNLFHIYTKLNMFRATHRPSSEAKNCNSSLWICIRERLLDDEVAGRWQRPETSTYNNVSRMQNQRLLLQFWASDDGRCVARNMLSFI
jgi:hypothetical protein